MAIVEVDDSFKRPGTIPFSWEIRPGVPKPGFSQPPKKTCWAAGKEGNMRALLSSLHLVLWPKCGWEAVSLTDLITFEAVKKVCKKANLYVHPDKVHQKGVQQKYIAEKEAWNKFNSEELS